MRSSVILGDKSFLVLLRYEAMSEATKTKISIDKSESAGLWNTRKVIISVLMNLRLELRLLCVSFPSS